MKFSNIKCAYIHKENATIEFLKLSQVEIPVWGTLQSEEHDEPWLQLVDITELHYETPTCDCYKPRAATGIYAISANKKNHLTLEEAGEIQPNQAGSNCASLSDSCLILNNLSKSSIEKFNSNSLQWQSKKGSEIASTHFKISIPGSCLLFWACIQVSPRQQKVQQEKNALILKEKEGDDNGQEKRNHVKNEHLKEASKEDGIGLIFHWDDTVKIIRDFEYEHLRPLEYRSRRPIFQKFLAMLGQRWWKLPYGEYQNIDTNRKWQQAMLESNNVVRNGSLILDGYASFSQAPMNVLNWITDRKLQYVLCYRDEWEERVMDMGPIPSSNPSFQCSNCQKLDQLSNPISKVNTDWHKICKILVQQDEAHDSFWPTEIAFASSKSMAKIKAALCLLKEIYLCTKPREDDYLDSTKHIQIEPEKEVGEMQVQKLKIHSKQSLGQDQSDNNLNHTHREYLPPLPLSLDVKEMIESFNEDNANIGSSKNGLGQDQSSISIQSNTCVQFSFFHFNFYKNILYPGNLETRAYYPNGISLDVMVTERENDARLIEKWVPGSAISSTATNSSTNTVTNHAEGAFKWCKVKIAPSIPTFLDIIAATMCQGEYASVLVSSKYDLIENGFELVSTRPTTFLIKIPIKPTVYQSLYFPKSNKKSLDIEKIRHAEKKRLNGNILYTQKMYKLALDQYLSGEMEIMGSTGNWPMTSESLTEMIYKLAKNAATACYMMYISEYKIEQFKSNKKQNKVNSKMDIKESTQNRILKMEQELKNTDPASMDVGTNDQNDAGSTTSLHIINPGSQDPKYIHQTGINKVMDKPIILDPYEKKLLRRLILDRSGHSPVNHTWFDLPLIYNGSNIESTTLLEAERQINMALDAKPRDPSARLKKVHILCLNFKLEQARALLEKMKNVDPIYLNDLQRAHQVLAYINSKRGV